jgi:transcription antitermination factor NusG
VFLLVVDGHWWDAARTPGVLRILRSGDDRPAVISSNIISELRSREHGGVIHLPKAPGLAKGDRVYIRSGPLQGLRGLYQGQSNGHRAVILLSLLSGPRHVNLPAADVEAV